MHFDYPKELSSLSYEQLLRFYELFAHNLTVSIRSIWSDENISDSEKVDRIKWINEISHRIISKTSCLRLNRNERTEEDTWRMITEYISDNENIRGEILLAIKYSFQAVKN